MEEETYRSQFRLPQSLYEKLKVSADENRRSLNAELVARLEESTLRDCPAGELVSANKAREMASISRRDLAAEVRDEILSSLRLAISRGLSAAYIELADYDLELMAPDERMEVVGNTERELIESGYKLQWDGDHLTVSF